MLRSLVGSDLCIRDSPLSLILRRPQGRLEGEA
jgi:hypothetical protein